DASRLGVKFGQSRCQIRRGWIGIDGGAIFLNRLVGQVAAAISRNLLFIHVGESEVVVSSSPVGWFLLACGGRSGRRSVSRRRARCRRRRVLARQERPG